MPKKPAVERFDEMEAKNLEAAEIILAGRYDGLMLEWATRVKEKLQKEHDNGSLG